MEEKAGAKSHRIVFNARKNGTITGVVDVLSFDLSEILLETEQGMLMIKGSDLHVNRLTLEKGEVHIDGHVDSLIYSSGQKSQKNSEKGLGRFFR